MRENTKHYLEALEKYANDLQKQTYITLGHISYLTRLVAEVAEVARRDEVYAALAQEKGA